MAEIITYLHDKVNVMHKDLHCRNWLVLGDGSLKLIDFGCARFLGLDGFMPVKTERYYAE